MKAIKPNELKNYRDEKSGFRFDEDVTIFGNLSTLGDIVARGTLNVRGRVKCVGSLIAQNLYCRDNVTVYGDHFIILGEMIWPHAAPPTLPERYYIHQFLPPTWQHAYYVNRFGLECGQCERMLTSLRKHAEELLPKIDLTDVDLLIIKTSFNLEQPFPDWVKRILSRRFPNT